LAIDAEQTIHDSLSKIYIVKDLVHFIHRNAVFQRSKSNVSFSCGQWKQV